MLIRGDRDCVLVSEYDAAKYAGWIGRLSVDAGVKELAIDGLLTPAQRDALECAELEAKLEEAQREKIIGMVEHLCPVSLHHQVSYWRDGDRLRFPGATKLLALTAAVAEVEKLRQPAKPEPDEMDLTAVCAEIVALGFHSHSGGAGFPVLLWHNAHQTDQGFGLEQRPGESPEHFHRRALHRIREVVSDA